MHQLGQVRAILRNAAHRVAPQRFVFQHTSAACCVAAQTCCNAAQRNVLQRKAAPCSGVRNQLIGLAQYASQLERINADIASQARARARNHREHGAALRAPFRSFRWRGGTGWDGYKRLQRR